ncbi:MAG: T9SS type A sorting domain-containing protein [Cytophagaceae bacterium]|jgi:hypothetical protein|nr:T9SS type A sorting domain-containing protein [Cytophagaceae bacterium]
MKNPTQEFISISLLSNWKSHYLALATVLYVCAAFFAWQQLSLLPVPQPSPPPSTSELCMVPIQTNATVQSVAHIGAVTTPVGTSIAGLKRWSAASSWVGGIKPNLSDDVLIPANSVIVLDENISAKSITVQGKLIVDITKNISIATDYIMIKGASAYLEWGTRTQPYQNKGVITLTGNSRLAKIPGSTIESKAIVVAEGGILELNGARKASWSNLSTNAAAGATKIRIANTNLQWKIGDEILITSSRRDYNEAEKRRIISAAVIGNEVEFGIDLGLAFPHIGKIKTYTRPSDGKTWTADMRAEVGMLTKSIRIEGDENSEALQHGGHVMVHMNGKAFIDGVEFFRMGQKSILGRYPFHWHMLMDKGAGQYFKNNSVHRSYNRAITIHGTESTLVENNFCYDHIGHGIFLEDGSERFNVIRGNVVLLTKRPLEGEEVTPSDNQLNEPQNRTPGSFWITNPNNTFENNIAAGTQGTGYWFIMPRKPMGLSASTNEYKNMEPFKEAMIKFSGNKAHSCVSGFDIFDQLNSDHSIDKNQAWLRTDLRVMENCTWYACDLAVYGGIGGGRPYTNSVVFRNNIFLDNETALMHANYSVIEQSLFVSNSGEDVFVGLRQLNRGYDGACTIRNCHLVGWQASNANFLQNTGGGLKHVNYRLSGITTDHQGPPRMELSNFNFIPKGEVTTTKNAGAHPRNWSYVTWDIDGSLGGKPNTSIITNHPLCRDGNEVRYSNWTNIYRTDNRFAMLVINDPRDEDPRATLVRTKPGTPKAGQYFIYGFYAGSIQFPLIVNNGFLYSMQFESLPQSKTLSFRMLDSYVPGDKILMAIRDFGRIPGITVSGRTRYASRAALEAAAGAGFAIQNDTLFLKMVSVASSPDQTYQITWTGSITMPVIDTDGDGISDKQESIDGTDPIPNGPIPAAQVIPINPSCTAALSGANSFCAGSSTTLTASAGASYRWMKDGVTITGQVAPTLSVNAAGSYTVEVTNAAGCKALSAAKVISINALPSAAISSPVNAICAGSSTTLTASAGASYRWMKDGVTITGQAAPTLSVNAAGSYTVEVTNAAGCKAVSAAKVITIEALPSATISSPVNAICAGGSTTLTASAGASYRWMKDGVTITGQVAPTLSVNAAGSYMVEVTNAAGCKAVSAAKVISVQTPVASITVPSNTICAGSSILLTATSGTAYVWRKDGVLISGANAATLSVATAGSYSVTVTFPGSCSATSAPVAMQVSPLPLATISSTSTSFCEGSALVLSASAGNAYAWRNNGVAINGAVGANYSASTSGSYSVEVTNVAGCKAISAPLLITMQASTTWYADADNDGKGDAASTIRACTQPQGYVATAGDACPTDPLKLAPGTCGCNVVESSCAVADIQGPSCGLPLQTLNFMIDPSRRVGATNYNWWFGGSMAQITPSADKTSVAIKLSQYFTTGTICVGVSLNSAPYYKQYCKAVNTCVQPAPAADPLRSASKVQVFPNPSGEAEVLVDATEREEVPTKIQILNTVGEVIFETNQTHVQTTLATSHLANGTYTLKVFFGVEIMLQRLVILK